MADDVGVQESSSFGAVLRQLRVGAGLTQEALAERSGLGIRSIQGLERGETHPRRETLRRLTRALGLSADDAARFEHAGQPSPRSHREDDPGGVSHEHPRPESGVRHNLPVQLTTFVGREREQSTLASTVSATRLLTLVGTGGCGKTRLALQVAAEAIDRFPDGVWLAELAPLSDSGLVAKAVATALGVREAADRPIRETLLASLRSRCLLLVLDNCEHLIDGSAALADAVLRACPNVQILATSREPLGIDGEVAWRVPSLSVGPDDDAARPEQVLAYEAARLFVDRAIAAEPTFALNRHNAAAVSQVCRRLDGIPLAIELAARRVRALSAEQIAERLDHRFHLLTGGSRAALPRQQTLAATVEWSYNLLDPAERALFERLAVFAGGFTLDACESIVDDGPSCGAALGLLTQLVEKSLVLAETVADGTKRYRLLETLRQYAHERLLETGELDDVRRRHAAHFAALAEEAGRQVLGADQVTWLDRLDRDHDNVHAALAWAIERGQAELGLRMAAGLAYFWYFRGHYSEGRSLRAAVLGLPSGPATDALRSEVLQGGGMLALHQGDYPTARGFVEESVSLARRVGDRRLLAAALAIMGFVTRVQCDYATAQVVLEEGRDLARAAGDSFHAAMAVHHLGLLALEGDRDAEAAWTLNEESLALFRELGNRRMIGVTLLAMGRAARLRGDAEQARALIGEALSLTMQVGDTGHLPQMLCHVGALEADAGHVERAVRLAACAITLNAREGTRLWPVVERERDAWLAEVRCRLGEERFAAAWAEGAALTRDQAVAEALATTGKSAAATDVVPERV